MHAADGQGLGADISAQASGVAEAVIARQAAVAAIDQGGAAGRHGLAGAGVFIAERSAEAGDAKGFAAHQAIQRTTAEAGEVVAVIHLAVGSQAADGQGLGADIRAQTRGAAQDVVAGQAGTIGQAATADGDRFGITDVGVQEHPGQCAEAQGFTADQTAEHATG